MANNSCNLPPQTHASNTELTNSIADLRGHLNVLTTDHFDIDETHPPISTHTDVEGRETVEIPTPKCQVNVMCELCRTLWLSDPDPHDRHVCRNCCPPQKATATTLDDYCAEVEEDVKTADDTYDPPTHAALTDDGSSAICLDSMVCTDQVDAGMRIATADNDIDAAAIIDSNFHKKRTRSGKRWGKGTSNMIKTARTMASVADKGKRALF